MNPTNTIMLQPEPLDALLTPEAASSVLAVAPATLEKWRGKGQGPTFVKLSSRVVRYRRGDLIAFVAGAVRH